MELKKISPEDMLEEIADKLIIYLKEGSISIDSFLKKIDLNINNIEELLRIHFILKNEVISFIKKLPWRIRNIKTSTQKFNRQYKGEIRGRINWNKTIKKRTKYNNKDSTLFVCEERNKDFNIKENIVLKKLLSIIYSIINEDLEGKPGNYSWLNEWLGNDKLAELLDNIYYKNVYLKRINISEKVVTDRMIQDTKKSRNILYQEAAQLLEFYKRFIEEENWKNNNVEIIKLLKNTFIKPEKESVLFELYWIIKLIEANSRNYNLELVDGSKNIVASWEKENYKYMLYHDSTGSSRIKWSANINEFNEVKNEFLKRKLNSREKAREISDIFSNKINSTYWSGRPDIIIEVINQDKNQLEKVVIGEVKYTNKESTAKEGLKELMDYLYLIKGKKRDKYLKDCDVDLTALLLLDKIEVEQYNYIKGIKINKFNKMEVIENELFMDHF